MTSPLEHFFEQAARRSAEPAAGTPPEGAAPVERHDLTVVLEPASDATMELPVVPDDAPVVTPQAPAMPAVRAAPPVRRRPSGRRPPVAALAAAGALVLVAGVAAAGLRSADRDERAATTTSAAPAAAAVRVPAGEVRARASTTQRPDGRISYAPASTLDGRPETAWNSRGQGAGAWLAYTFATPVDLASITVLNGYQKTRPGKDGGVIDLFALNERVRVVRVVTDGGSVEWTLRDDRAPQTLTRAFGTTRSVRLQVVSTYPSAKYDDLAVSEVRFTARG